MAEKLRQEGFTLTTDLSKGLAFTYDREVMVLMPINPMENSPIFGRQCPERRIRTSVAAQENRVAVSLADTGPGMPEHALKEVFDDFYRVEDAWTRMTGVTGIGLPPVKKFMQAMGGTASAANNRGPGYIITLGLPRA